MYNSVDKKFLKVNLDYKEYSTQKSNEIYELGVNSLEQNPNLAKRFFESALEIDPFNKLAFRELLEIYKEENEFKNSISLFKKLIQNNQSESNYYFYGKFLFENSKYKASVHYLKKSLSLNKKFLPSHNLLAEIYYLHGSKKFSEQYLRNAIKLDSSNEKNIQMLIHILYSEKKFSDCLEFLEKYLKLNPIDKDEIIRKIKVLLNLNHDLDAFNFLIEYLDSDESNSFFISRVQKNSIEKTSNELLELRTKKMEFLKSSQDRNEILKLNYELSLINLFLGQRKKAIKFIIEFFKLKENLS